MAESETISVALPPEILTVVQEAVEAGEYASRSDVLRDALREWTETRRARQEGNGLNGDELRRLWQQSVDDPRPHVPMDEVFDRLESHFLQMAEQGEKAK